MNAASALLATLQLVKLGNDLLREWQAGQLTDEQAVERYKTVIAPAARLADQRWEDAGEPSSEHPPV
jgi:hypothetical protein